MFFILKYFTFLFSYVWKVPQCTRNSFFYIKYTLGIIYVVLITCGVWTRKQSHFGWRESCGPVVEHSAHDRKVVSSIPVQCLMEVVSKPCQDRFLYPILVHYRKIRKIQSGKWGTPKFFLNINKIKKHIGTKI